MLVQIAVEATSMAQPKLTFYRQKRVDGGVRTGGEWLGSSLLQRFERGDDDDSSLLWYVDLRFSGPRLPKEPDGVRDWLIEQEPWILDAMGHAARDLDVGIDADVLPYKRLCGEAPAGISLELAASAQRRVPGHQVGKTVRQIGRRWRRMIESLEPLAVK
jgi:hypothetical protein